MCWQKDLAIDGFPGVSELSDNALGQRLSLACGTDEVIDFELNDVGPRIDFLQSLSIDCDIWKKREAAARTTTVLLICSALAVICNSKTLQPLRMMAI